MNFNIKEIFTAFMILFAVIDIVGNIPIIIDLRKKVGHIQSEKASIIAGAIMIFFLFIGENILARIQVSNPLFSIIINNGEDHVFKSRDYFGDVKIRKLRIKVLDKYGEVINLNHSEISLSLELTQRYSSAAQTTFNDVLDNSLFIL